MSDCIFCKIISGTIATPKIYEDDVFIVIKDINATAPCHLLLIPKIHTDNILTTPPEVISHICSKLNEITGVAQIKDAGFRVVINTGANGGQTVNHLHLHLLGGRELTWPAG